MIEFNSKSWSAHDPDGVLNLHRDKFDISELKFLGKIHPREDLLSFENHDSKIIVDFGFYGDEVKLDGNWQVYVVDGNLKECWSSPLEHYQFKFGEFVQGTICIQTLLEKYT